MLNRTRGTSKKGRFRKRAVLANARVCKRWFPNGGSSLVRRANSGTPLFNLNFTSILPLSYLNLPLLTSSLPQCNPCSAGNLESRFGKHGLQTLGNVPSSRFLLQGRTNLPSSWNLVFGAGEHPNVPSFLFLVQGNIRQNHRFGNHHFVGRTSQLSGITVDFSGDCDGFCDGFFGQEGRILRRILWQIFCLVFP